MLYLKRRCFVQTVKHIEYNKYCWLTVPAAAWTAISIHFNSCLSHASMCFFCLVCQTQSGDGVLGRWVLSMSWCNYHGERNGLWGLQQQGHTRMESNSSSAKHTRDEEEFFFSPFRSALQLFPSLALPHLFIPLWGRWRETLAVNQTPR